MKLPAATLLASLAVTLIGRTASAQVIVSGVRDLNFGPVIQGIATQVAPSDPVRSGQFYFRTAALGTRVRIQFTLPTRLNGPAGATMPIAFRNNDAIARGTAPSSVPATFNPNGAAVFTMATSVDANVWLGGRVTPAANQAVGSYANTVVMTITVF
jgi:spore coat protein U-like protein